MFQLGYVSGTLVQVQEAELYQFFMLYNKTIIPYRIKCLQDTNLLLHFKNYFLDNFLPCLQDKFAQQGHNTPTFIKYLF